MNKMKLTLEHEVADALFLEMLYDGYELTYWVLRDAEEYYRKDINKNAFKLEDMRDANKALAAFEVLADRYTAGGADQAKLKAIRDRINYKYLIKQGMSNV